MKAIVVRMVVFIVAPLCFAQTPTEKQKEAVPSAGAPVEKARTESPKPREQLSKLRDAAKIGDPKDKIPIPKYESDVVGRNPSLKDLIDTSTRRIRDIPDSRAPSH